MRTVYVDTYQKLKERLLQELNSEDMMNERAIGLLADYFDDVHDLTYSVEEKELNKYINSCRAYIDKAEGFGIKEEAYREFLNEVLEVLDDVLPDTAGIPQIKS